MLVEQLARLKKTDDCLVTTPVLMDIPLSLKCNKMDLEVRKEVIPSRRGSPPQSINKMTSVPSVFSHKVIMMNHHHG